MTTTAHPELEGLERYKFGWADSDTVGASARRGMTEDETMATIVRGFVQPIARELPMEYALELNRLIELQMEGAVG